MGSIAALATEVAMQDKQAHLEKLRVQIAECEMIRDLATEPKKRELFTRLADRFKVLAGEIERAMVIPFGDTFLGRKTFESFPSEDDV
jgi:hypothetical protein